MARVTALLGLSFGDEGKGSSVDYICRKHSAKLVIRFNGGAQASHAVVESNGREHRFAQWGSGTFAGARTLLSRYMLVNPIFVLSEARSLEAIGVSNPMSLLFVEEDAVITTPFHVAANRIREIARAADGGVHGSCGMGVGETTSDVIAGQDDVITAAMFRDPEELSRRLKRCQERKCSEIQKLDFDRQFPAAELELGVLTDARVVGKAAEVCAVMASKATVVPSGPWLRWELESPGHVVFEGAQGVLLDQDWGFHPNTTWSDCTFRNVGRLLEGVTVDSVRRLGVLRTFLTRHGAGPFPTESKDLDVFSKDDHNKQGVWQGSFRSGAFDLVLARYALRVVGGCDGLVFTHLDKLLDPRDVAVCWAYEWPGSGQFSQHLLRQDPHNLAHQEQLGKLLASVKPIYERTKVGSEKDALEHVQGLASMLSTPLAMVSRGKTANDKAEF